MKRTTLIAALLGVVIGVLGAEIVQKTVQRRKLAADAAAWQKLNLALSQIDERYVDTLDYGKLTDVALTAVLQALDPHSLYMLPRQLEAADLLSRRNRTGEIVFENSLPGKAEASRRLFESED